MSTQLAQLLAELHAAGSVFDDLMIPPLFMQAGDDELVLPVGQSQSLLVIFLTEPLLAR
jgi:hypothetical protein